MWPKQNFQLSNEVLAAVTVQEVEATYAALQECDLARPPYDLFDVTILVAVYPSPEVNKKGGFIVVDNKRLHDRHRVEDQGVLATASFRYANGVFVSATIAAPGRAPEVLDAGNDQRTDYATPQALYRLLITLLATKNIIKETKENKLFKMGIGRKKDPYRYTTTLKIGAMTEHTDEGAHTGVMKRPHLRRGHVRSQHHGPGNQYVKKIFIEPVFVNADPKWISERTAYNVSM